MSWLSEIFKPGYRLNIPDTFLKKYETPLFKDISIQKELAQKGYAVRPLLDADDVLSLRKEFRKIEEHPDNEFSELFWNSGRATSTEVRNLARQSIDRFVKPKLEELFIPGKAELMGGVFVAKPSSASSALNPHQDSSHVEEEKYISVYAWCALTDVTLLNGAMHIVPGSHFFGNSQRSLNIPWQFEPFTDILWEYAVPVPMQAGEVLFFDSAAIHCSPPNKDEHLRLAVNFFVKPSESPFLHYFQDPGESKGMVEKFAVDINFYYDKDFEKRPGTEYPLVGKERYKNLHLSPQKLRQWCIQAAEKASEEL